MSRKVAWILSHFHPTSSVTILHYSIAAALRVATCTCMFCAIQQWLMILSNMRVPFTLLHVFEIPPLKCTTEYILKLLLSPNIDCSWICHTWQVSNIVGNATFVVDLTSLKHPDDVRKDFLGKWIHSGSHPFTFKATIDEDG